MIASPIPEQFTTIDAAQASDQHTARDVYDRETQDMLARLSETDRAAVIAELENPALQGDLYPAFDNGPGAP